MKLGWITWDEEDDKFPVFHMTEPYTYYWKVKTIVYAELIK